MDENERIPANCPRCQSPRLEDEFANLHCGEWTCLSYPEVNDGFHQTETCRVRELEAAVRTHRDQKADDRCIEDDDRLYAVLGDGVKCDRRVGDKHAMLRNCERFIERRCLGGGWPSYAELEQDLASRQQFKDWVHKWLDDHGVPSDPNPEHTEETGCRISGRMLYLWNRIEALEQEIESMPGIRGGQAPDGQPSPVY